MYIYVSYERPSSRVYTLMTICIYMYLYVCKYMYIYVCIYMYHMNDLQVACTL